MRAVVQRVSSARVVVEGEVVGACGVGLLVFVAAHREDTVANADRMADRVHGMRVFADSAGKMNLSLAQVPGASVLAVSNFTLYGDASQRRPSFVAAAGFDTGQALFDAFVDGLRSRGVGVATGVFGAHMTVESVNDGPVTLVLDA